MRHDHLIDEFEPRAFDRVLLRRLLGYLAPYRWRVALAVLLLLAASALQLAGPYLVKVKLEAVPISGTGGARMPFFSPDGQWIGFYAQGKLQKGPLAGGIPADT